jgi:hypothetical protein
MRGKVLIVVMLGVALGLAAFAWAWNYQRSAKARAFWGERAAAIRFAKKVEAFRLNLPEDSADYTDLHPLQGGLYQYADEPIDISAAPGLLNARTSLMSDDGFDWSVEPSTPAPSPEWKYGARFHDEKGDVTLLFSDRKNHMLVAETGQCVALDAKTSQGWLGYLEKALKK